MKRSVSNSHPNVAAFEPQSSTRNSTSQQLLPGRPRKRKRLRRRRLEPIGSICPGDQTGPRIASLLEEFERTCTVKSHMKWLHLLEKCCAREGCYISHCTSRGAFSMSHGAKTLVNCITMFLAYHVPRWCSLASDDEWRELLVALRAFHLYCVRHGYVVEDPVLMAALYKLRRFNIREIPRRIDSLARSKFWDGLETVTTTVLSLLDDSDEDECGDYGDDDDNSDENGDGSNGDDAREKTHHDGKSANTSNELNDDPNDGSGSNATQSTDGDGDISAESSASASGSGSGSGSDESRPSTKSEARQRKRRRKEKVPKYDRYFGDETPLLVAKIETDGWLLRCEDFTDDAPIQETTAFLRLPPDAVKLGMKSMALSGLQLALRNGVWRPIERDGVYIANAYPPDEVFYY